jgi:hypothetical protein
MINPQTSGSFHIFTSPKIATSGKQLPDSIAVSYVNLSCHPGHDDHIHTSDKARSMPTGRSGRQEMRKAFIN